MWPFAGVSVFPEQGDGVIWYNLFRNADSDWQTSHAGCPIILGGKWFGNKWVGYNPQWNTAKCGLFEEAVFDANYP